MGKCEESKIIYSTKTLAKIVSGPEAILQDEDSFWQDERPQKLTKLWAKAKMDDLMDKYHLEEQLVQPQQELQTGQVNCIPVSVQGKGHLKQIFNFFRSLQKLDRKIRISRVELTNSEDFSFGKSKLSVKADVGIYYTVEN